MSKKYTYIEVRERPWNRGQVVYRKDVAHLSTSGREEALSKLAEQYPPDSYAIATVVTPEMCAERN